MIKKLLVLENLSINKMMPSQGESPLFVPVDGIPAGIPAGIPDNHLDTQPSPQPSPQPSGIDKSPSPPPPPPRKTDNAANTGDESKAAELIDTSEGAGGVGRPAGAGGESKEAAEHPDTSERAGGVGRPAGAGDTSEGPGSDGRPAGAGGESKEAAEHPDTSEGAGGVGRPAGAGDTSEGPGSDGRPAGAGGESKEAAEHPDTSEGAARVSRLAGDVEKSEGVGRSTSPSLSPSLITNARPQSPIESENSTSSSLNECQSHTAPTTQGTSNPIVLSIQPMIKKFGENYVLGDLNGNNLEIKPNVGYETVKQSSSGHNLTSKTKLLSTNNPFRKLLSDHKIQYEKIKDKLIQHLDSIAQKFDLKSSDITSIKAKLKALLIEKKSFTGDYKSYVNDLIKDINALQLPNPDINHDDSAPDASQQPSNHFRKKAEEFNQYESTFKALRQDLQKSLVKTCEIKKLIAQTTDKRIAKTKLFESLINYFQLPCENNFEKSLNHDLQLLHENGYLDLYYDINVDPKNLSISPRQRSLVDSDSDTDDNPAPTLRCLPTYRQPKNALGRYIFKTNSFDFEKIEKVPENYAYYLYLRAKQYYEDYENSTKESLNGSGKIIPTLDGITPPNSKLKTVSLDNCLYLQQAQDIDEFVRLYRPAADAYFNQSTQIKVLSVTNNNIDGAQLKFGDCVVNDFSCIQYNSKTPKSTILFKKDFDEIVVYKTKLAERLMLFDGIKRAMNKRGVFIEGIDFDRDYTLSHIDQKIKKALDRYENITEKPYCQDVNWQPNHFGALADLPQDFVGSASLVYNPSPQVNRSNQSLSDEFQDNLKKLQEKTFTHGVSEDGSPLYHCFDINLQKKYLHEADILLQNKILHKNRSKLSRDKNGNYLDYDDDNIKSFIDISRHHNDSTGITTVNIEIGGELTEDEQKFLQICIGEKKDVFQQFKFKQKAESSTLKINESEEITYFVKKGNKMIGAKYQNGYLIDLPETEDSDKLTKAEKNKILKAIKTTKVKIKEIANDGKVDNTYKISPKSQSFIIKDKAARLIKTKSIKPQPKQNSYSLNLKTSDGDQTIDKNGFIQIGNLYKTSFALTKRKEKLYDFYLQKDQNNQFKLFYRGSQTEIDDLEKQVTNQELDIKEKIKIAQKLCKLKEYRQYDSSSLKSGNLTMILGNQDDKFLAHPRHFIRDDQGRKLRFSNTNLKFSSQEEDIKKIISQRKHNGWKIFGGYGGNIKKEFSLQVFDPKNQAISHLILTPKTKGFLNSTTKIKITESEKSHHAKPNSQISQPRGTNFFRAIRDSFRE